MDDSVKTFQRIQILLAEYATLRAELLSRYTAQFQSGGIAAIILLSIITLAATKNSSFLLLLVADAILFGAVMFWIDVDIAKAARRLRALEQEINTMAGEPPLLKWETFFGLGGIVGERYLRWKERRASAAAAKRV